MQVILDLLGSIVIGGLLILMMLNLNSSISESAATQTFNNITQQNLTAVSDILENDFRKMGYHIFDSVKVTYTDTAEIKFQTDLYSDSVIHVVHYYFNPAAVSGQENTNTHVLYRQIDNNPHMPINLGLTKFRLWYYDGAGNLLTGNSVATLAKIRAIKVAMSIESVSAWNKKYSGAYWERTIKPKNLF